MSMKQTFTLLLLLVLIGCQSARKEPAADFQLPDLDGNAWSLAAHRGRPVLLTFLATWCEKCRDELAALAAIVQEFPVPVAVVCRDPQNREQIRQLFGGAGLPAPVLADDKIVVFSQFDIQNLPTTILLDPEGYEVMRATGGDAADHKRLRRYLERMLSTKKHKRRAK